MKILFVDVVSELGGAQQSLIELCAGLSKADVQIAVAVPKGPLFDVLQARGIRLYPIVPIRASKQGLRFFSTLAKFFVAPTSIAGIIRDFKPHIVHANHIAAAIAVHKTPPNTLFFTHIRDLRTPTLAIRSVAPHLHRILAISTAVDEFLSETLPRSAQGHVRMMRNGIDVQRFSPGDRAMSRKAFDLPEKAPIIGMIAHLIPWKRHSLFVEAAAKIKACIPEAHFVIVGQDLFAEHAAWGVQLKEQVRQLGLSSCFTWIHTLSQSEKILPAFDLLIHPAKNEPFGRVVCEAMAMEIPVIASSSGGIPDIIDHDVNGILLPSTTPDRMAAQAVDLLSHPEKARRLASAGRRRILEKFTLERLCQQLLKEYATVCADEHIVLVENDADAAPQE